MSGKAIREKKSGDRLLFVLEHRYFRINAVKQQNALRLCGEGQCRILFQHVSSGFVITCRVLWFAHVDVLFAWDSLCRRVDSVPVTALDSIYLFTLFLAALFVRDKLCHPSSPALKL